MGKEKACKKCRLIYEGAKCPECGSNEHSDTPKGKIIVLEPETSEIAKNLKITKKGNFALRMN